MIETRLFCSLNGGNSITREQKRLLELTDSGLLEADSIPVLEEVTQTAAQFLQMPICWVGLMERDSLWLKTTLGLGKLGLRNQLSTSRRLDRQESFCIHVVDSHQVLAIPDTTRHPAFAQSGLAQTYGLRAYLGAPLLGANGCCLGTLAVLDLVPHEFTEQEVQILHMLARWCISEFERDRLLSLQAGAPSSPSALSPSIALSSGTGADAIRSQSGAVAGSSIAASSVTTSPIAGTSTGTPAHTHTSNSPATPPTLPVRLQLVGQLVEKITSPLTAILGMAGMLNREIYGPLTHKQREYLDVILNSGQTLQSLVQEIVELAHVNDRPTALELVPVDVEMLCQQVVQSLADVAKNYQLQLQFSVEPGQRLWSLDRVKMRQMLYHLIYGIIQSARTDGVLRLHGSRKRNHLRFALWLSNPWLDEGMLPMDGIQSFLANESRNETGLEFTLESTPSGGTTGAGIGLLPNRDLEVTPLNPAVLDDRPEHLRFLLSQHLAGLHGGTLTVQNSTESGCRYILTIPLQDMPQDT